MQPHQQRVVDEHYELAKKVAALSAFINRADFATVDEAEQQRLKQQLGHMELYLDVLSQRIEAF